MRSLRVRLAWFVVLFATLASPWTVKAMGDSAAEAEDVVVAKWKAMEAAMRGAVQGALKKALPEVLRMGQEDGLSAACTSAFIGLLRRFRNMDTEVMKMLDASGKLAPGLLDGSLTDFGNYEECLGVAVPDGSSQEGAVLFRGQYCMVKSRPPLPPKPRFVRANFAAVNVTLFPDDSVMRELSMGAGTFYSTTARAGLCMPSVCSREDVEAIAKSVFRPLHWDAFVSGCTQDLPVHLTQKDKIFIGILVFLSLPVVLSTAVHIVHALFLKSPRYAKHHGLLLDRLSSMSAYETVRKIMVVNEPADEETRHLQIFHGLRALSIVWIVWVHHYAYNDTSVYSGAKIAKKLAAQYNTQPFNNAWLAVDTFFFISGFFLLYAIHKQMRSAGLAQALFYLAVRWWRLIPMACVGIFMVNLIRHFGDGPLWAEYIGSEVEKCNKNWWLLLLNVQNYLLHDELCLVPYWYISTDMQLHIIFIGFAILLFRNFYLSLVTMVFLVITGTIVVGCQTLVYNYTPTALFVAGDPRFAKEVLEQIYFRPYTHFGPFCLGMAVAYSFVTKKPRFELNLVFQGAAWSAAFVAGATVLFCTKQWGDGDALPEAWIAAVYAACHRLVWALCIGWLVFACISGHGGLVQSVLSSPLLVPLSRLSYAVYVLHVPLVWFRLWTIRERILIWFLPMFYNAMGTLVLAFFVALGASVFIERPLVVVKDLVLKCYVAPPSAKFSQRDGQTAMGGAKADGVRERNMLAATVLSARSKLAGGRCTAKEPPKQPPRTAAGPVFQNESCTVHL
ncbi:nose resistant to fluoxetine protein 6-like [Haemaphysalis longicornis]